jgi:hypothetical protein
MSTVLYCETMALWARGVAQTWVPSYPTLQQSMSNPTRTSAGDLYRRSTIWMCLCGYCETRLIACLLLNAMTS